MEEAPQPPQLSKQDLVNMGGWAVHREAVEMLELQAVKKLEWAPPVLTGLIKLGGQEYRPRINLRSLVFPENKCSCFKGRQGFICAHAVAICMQVGKPLPPEPPPEVVVEVTPVKPKRGRKKKADIEAEAAALEAAKLEAEKAAEAAAKAAEEAAKAKEAARAAAAEKLAKQPKLVSLRLHPTKGMRLSFRLFLPPNIAKAAENDKIMVKLDALVEGVATLPEKIDRSKLYALEQAMGETAFLVESWCGGKLLGFMQLKRAQVQALLNIMKGVPCVFWINKPNEPLKWTDGQIAGVSQHLVEASSFVSQGPRKEIVEAPKPPPPKEEPFPPYPKPFRYDRPMLDGSTQFLSVTSPNRDDVLYDEFTALLRASHFVHEPSNGKWWIRDQHKVLNFLAKEFGKIGRRYQVTYSDNFKKRTAHLRRLRVHTIIRQKAGIHSLEMTLKAENVPSETIMQNVAIGRYYVIKEDTIVLLDPEKIDAILQAQRAIIGQHDAPLNPILKTALGRRDLIDVHNELRPVSEEYNVPNDWTVRVKAIRELTNLQPAPINETFAKLLRPYQLLGVSWLYYLYQEGLGAILADEMGLGKTIEALGLMLAIRGDALAKKPDARPAPTLVVCPASLVENWRREAARFAPELRSFVHHRDRRITSVADATNYDLVITSYTTMARDSELFRACDWKLLIADEAQHIKNRKTQHAIALRSIMAEGRFVLTGTPVENSLDDLRSIFDFIMPGLLLKIPEGVKNDDRGWFDERHRRQAAPYILRRTKQAVAPELPDKITQIVYCELSPKQRQLYESYRIKSEKEIFQMEMAGVSEQKVRFAAFTQLLRLRQICAEPRILDDKLSPDDSAKLEALDELIDESIDGDHRLLVFSQFVSVLGFLRTYLETRGVNYCYLDGSTSNRQAVVDRFNNDASNTVFLISLKAGGVGLNLTGADTVVHFDPWWNPAVEAQATDRAHRIGQTKVVTSVKLITAGTIEEKVVELQKSKLGLLEALFEESAEASSKISLAEIKELFKA